MAEPLKHSFGPEIPKRIGKMIARVERGFDQKRFLRAALDGYDALELMPRARHIAEALARSLPPDRERAIEILIDSLEPEIPDRDRVGMESFIYCPHAFFVAKYGLDCFETSMRAQHELTRRFTAEFSIRPFLEHFTDRTLAQLHSWTRDPNHHVRRLVSEGTRPRLPWAPRLPRFQKDPAPVIKLLELLKDDPEEYVRRSVANNLNDISKDHPDRVLSLARRWWKGANPNRKRLVRHGLRTLIKQANPAALAVLGYPNDSTAVIDRISGIPDRVRIGDKVRIEVDIRNPSDKDISVLVDLRVHFVKSSGATSPRVFKGAEITVGPSDTATVRKTVSMAQHSTRTHYPGTHRIEIMLNGTTHPGRQFLVV